MPRFITRTHTEEIGPDHLSYTVQAEGSADPFNEEIVIENLGPGMLKSPVVTVDGLFNWSTSEDMVAEITRGCSTDEERALAIYNWVRTHGDHQYSGDRKGLNPVVFFNVFGHGICAYFASAQTALARAAGLDARVWEIRHHTVAEIEYDGAWHMLDPDCHLFFLGKDNRTIASIEEIEKDLAFYSRTRAYRRIFADAHGKVRNEWQSEHRVHRYDLREPRYVQYDYDPYIYAPASMDYTLLPGETMVRRWQGWGKHYEYRDARLLEPLEDEPHKPFPPARYSNGYVLYRPALDREMDLEPFTTMNVTWAPGAIRVDTPQDSARGARSLFVYRRPLPYLLVGGEVSGEALKEGDAAYDRFEVVGYKRTHKPEREHLYQQEVAGRRRFEVDLDDFLYPGRDQCAWEHEVHVLMGVYSGHEEATTTALTDLEVKTEFQVASRSLPALKMGTNRIDILHQTPAERPFTARVTHIWTERHGIEVGKPPIPLTPLDAEEGVCFQWKGREDGDESYYFQLSPHHLCAFALSPNFDLDLRDPTLEFVVEKGWLNPKTRYYWRVRAKSRHGLWGPWCAIQSFVTR